LTSIMPRNTLQILSKNPSTSNSIFSKVREWIFPKHTFPDTLMIGLQQTKKLQLVSIFNRTYEDVEVVHFALSNCVTADKFYFRSSRNSVRDSKTCNKRTLRKTITIINTVYGSNLWFWVQNRFFWTIIL
jgi:hypothetical protein